MSGRQSSTSPTHRLPEKHVILREVVSAEQTAQHSDRRLKHIDVLGHVHTEVVRHPGTRLAKLCDRERGREGSR